MLPSTNHTTGYDVDADEGWPLEEGRAWEKVLTGIAWVHGALIVPAGGALVFGMLFLAFVDFRRPETALQLGLLGLGTTYTLGLAVVSVGLSLCCQAPDSCKGKRFAAATLVLTITAGSLLAVTYTLEVIRPPWFSQIRASFGWFSTSVAVMTWTSASLA